MSDKDLLKEYIATVVQEGAFRRDTASEDDDSSKKKKGKGFWQKVKSFFMGDDHAVEIAEEWIEDQELNYDFEFDDKSKKSILDFVGKKYDLALRKGRGDKAKAESIMQRALDTKYRGFLRQVQAQADSEFNKQMQDDEDQ